VTTLVCAIGFATLALAGAGEPASVPTVQLDWVAPAECPSVDDVVAMAERNIATEGRGVHADAQVRRAQSGYRLRLTLHGNGEAHVREVDAESCQAVAEAAALLVAVASESRGAQPAVDASEVQPDAPAFVPPPPESNADDSPAQSETAVEATAAPREDAARPSPPTPKRDRRLSGLVRLDGMLQLLRLLPGATAGVGLSGGIRGRRWRAEARARYAFARPVDDSAPLQGGADISLWTGGASGCYEPRFGRISLPLCGGASVGQMLASGRDVARPQDAVFPFAEVTAGGGATMAFTRTIALAVGIEGALSIVRPKFHVEDRPPLFRAGAGATRVLAGLEVRLP